MQDRTLRLHRFEPGSRVNGPGLRAVVWVQGCGLGCPGCFNPETHDFTGGEDHPVEQLAGQILALKGRIQGITISGGEPLAQPAALARLLERISTDSALSVLIFTGFTWEEAQKITCIDTILTHTDLLIAGRYDRTRRLGQGLIGSSNKTAHFLTGRYTLADLEAVPQAEVILSPDGEIILSGIDPLQW